MPNRKIGNGRASSLSRHMLRNRPWMLCSLLFAVIAGFCLPVHLSVATRVLIGWNCFQWPVLLTVLHLMTGATPEKIRSAAIALDESDEIVLGIISVGSICALCFVVYEMLTGKNAEGIRLATHIGLSFFTLAGLWTLVPMLFAVNYAHDWYTAEDKGRPIRFPDDIEEPGYWDFAYFSFTVAVACQTADIDVTSSRGRKFVLFQSVLSFIFNTTVLGLTINIAAGVLS